MKAFFLAALMSIAACSISYGKPVIKITKDASKAGVVVSTNGDFEKAVGNELTDWKYFGDGYSVAKGEGRNNSTAMFCESNSASGQYGGQQVIEINQNDAYPIAVTAWSRCQEVDGAPGSDYSLYIDLECMDGSFIWGHVKPFQTGSSGWNSVTYTIFPAKPVKNISTHCLFRNKKGKVWFDDVQISTLKVEQNDKIFQGQMITVGTSSKSNRNARIGTQTGLSLNFNGANASAISYADRNYSSEAPAGFLVRDVKADSDYHEFNATALTETAISASCPELNLKVDANFAAEENSIRISGTIRDLTNKDRAVNIIFALPMDALGWKWWDDVNHNRQIISSSTNLLNIEYINPTIIACGSTSTASLYPVAAISGKDDGIGIGVDMDKAAVYRITYNSATNQFLISYDFALIPESIKHPSSADFSFVIYRFDPAWGFRQAWTDYAKLFPEFFNVRTTKQGIWMPFGDISRVEGWEDFGFRYHEGTENVPFDNANDIQAFRYSEPTTWWMDMRRDVERNDTTVMDEAKRVANESKTYVGTYAKAVLNAVMHDENGRPCYSVQDAPWCYGVVWNINPCPYIPETPNGSTLVWNDNVKEQDYGSNTENIRTGEYLDSLEGYVTVDLNYRREHFKYSSVPLCFDEKRNPTLFKGLSIYEMTKWMANDVHGIGKLMFANAVPYKYSYLTPWLDVMGTETNWLDSNKRYSPDSIDTMYFRRTLCYGKPYLLLMNTRFDDFGNDMVEKYFRRCAFFAIMPSMFSHDAANDTYFSTPRWYNRDRELFKRYIPIIRRLAEAGWEPVTFAQTEHKDVYIERYAERYLTILNDSNAPLEVDVKLDSARLALEDNANAIEMFSGSSVSLQNSAFRVHVEAGDTAVVDLKP